MAGASLLAGWMLGLSSVSLLPASEIAVDGTVRIGDVASLEALEPDLRDRVAGREIAALPAGRSRVVMSRAALAALVRRSVPGLDVAAGPGEVTLRRAAQPANVAAGACFALARPIEAGSILAAPDMLPVACRTERQAIDIVYDGRVGAARASTYLAAGTYLGRIALPDPPQVARGDALTLASQAGPVRIERTVVALQAGRSGGSVFVRTQDGEVLAAPLAAEPAEDSQ